MNRRVRVVLAVLLVLCLRPLQADDPGCPDAELFSGKLTTDICWGCLFPIRIAGLSIGGGDKIVDCTQSVAVPGNHIRSDEQPVEALVFKESDAGAAMANHRVKNTQKRREC